MTCCGTTRPSYRLWLTQDGRTIDGGTTDAKLPVYIAEVATRLLQAGESGEFAVSFEYRRQAYPAGVLSLTLPAAWRYSPR